jgi:hypothetical protein
MEEDGMVMETWMTNCGLLLELSQLFHEYSILLRFLNSPRSQVGPALAIMLQSKSALKQVSGELLIVFARCLPILFYVLVFLWISLPYFK